jgi:hypothetical protein
MQKLREQPRTTSSLIHQVLLIASFLGSISIAMDFDVLDSINFGLFTTVNIACGSILYMVMRKDCEFNTAELLGMGIALGTASPALINICLRLIGINSQLTTLIFPLLTISCVSILRQKTNQIRKSISAISLIDLQLILFTSLISLVAWINSLLPFSVIAGVFILIDYLHRNGLFNRVKKARTASIRWNITTIVSFPLLAFFCTEVTSFWRKTPIWKDLAGVDSAFDEAQSHGVSSFGIADNILRANSPTKGHILTHAWAGDIASFLDLPRFLSTGGVGFALGIIGISSLVVALAIREFDSVKVGRFALLIIYLQASLPEEFLVVPAPRMANSISLLLLISFFFLFLDHLKKLLNRSYFVLPLFISLLTLAKFHWAMAAVFTISLVSAYDFLRFKSISSLQIPITSFVAFLVTYLLFLRGMDAHSPVGINFTIDMAVLIISVLVLRFHLFSARSFFKFDNKVHLLTVSLLLFAVMLLAVTNGSNNTTYFINASLILWSLFIAKHICELLANHSERLKQLLLLGFLSFSIGITTSVFYLFANYRLINNPRYRFLQIFVVHFPQLLQISVIFLAFLVVLFVYRYAKMTRFISPFVKTPFTLLLSIMVVCANFGTWIVVSNRAQVLSIWYDISDGAQYVFNDDQFVVAEWLMVNTDADDILATNSICTQMLEMGDTTPYNEFGPDCKNRNMFTWIAALAHRKMLFESPLTGPMSIGASLSALEVSDYNSVVSFGSTIDASSKSHLESRGVEWFIVDREQTLSNNWRSLTDVRFSTDNYFVVRL